MMRRLLCWLGFHTYQYLLAPPTWRRGDRYDPGIWCIWCCKRGPRGSGDGALVARGPRAPTPDMAGAALGAACG